jgi:hypothetical protein
MVIKALGKGVQPRAQIVGTLTRPDDWSKTGLVIASRWSAHSGHFLNKAHSLINLGQVTEDKLLFQAT